MNKERLETLLYNALIWLEEDCADFFTCEDVDKYEWFEKTIGITKQEFEELTNGVSHD